MPVPRMYGLYSIRTALVLPSIISFIVAVALITSLVFVDSRKALDTILLELQQTMITMVEADMNTRINEAVQMNLLNRDAFERGILQLDDTHGRERYFTMMLQRFPDVAMTYIGLPDGAFYGARRNINGTLSVVRNNAATGGSSDYYLANAMGDGAAFLERFENFDPRVSPWYQMAAKSQEPVFSDLYSHFIFKEPTLTAAIPVYTDSDLIGVFGVDYLMSWLGDTLRKLPTGSHGLVFIVDSENRFIATSSGEPIFRMADGKAVVIPAQDSTNALTRAVIARAGRMDDNVRLPLTVDRREYYVGVDHYTNQNLKWTIYTVIARDDFLSETRKTLSTALQTVLALTILFVIYSIALTRHIVRPILLLNESARLLASGIYKPVEKRPRHDELSEFTDSFNAMGKQLIDLVNHLEVEVAQRTTELEEKNAQLRELSYLDELAQIPNRRRFDEFFAQAVELSARNQRPLCLMMLDIDHFKRFNDLYGHVAGDHCIQAVCNVMRRHVHRSIDLTARYGGEEFAIVLQDPTISGALRIAEAIRSDISQMKIRHEDSEWQVVTVSIGLVFGSTEIRQTPENIIQQADSALYRAKSGGRNRVESDRLKIDWEPEP